ncbi:phospholipase D [Ceratobasidium sp. AG-I]|nr:phospholipase D [Ceratobasidium sp. AG-I]
MTLADIVAAATGSREADKDGAKRLPDIAERPPSPSKEPSGPTPSPNIALGALGGSFPRSWSLQHPATRASFSKPPRPGSFHPKLGPVPSADPATATDPFRADFRPADSEFRGAFQYHDEDTATPSSSRKAKRESWLGGFAPHERDKDKSRDGGHDEQPDAGAETEPEPETEHQEGGIWKRWIAEPLGLSDADDDPQSPRGTTTRGSTPRVSRQNTAEGPRTQKTVRAAKSLPQIRDREKSSRGTSNPSANASSAADPRAQSQSRRGSEAGASKWAILKPKIKHHVAQQQQQQQQAGSGVAANVTVTDELLVGGLGVLLLQMFFERDDQDRRRVPILLHHLKIRVSDSINPLNGRHAVFRIECEYANGAARWVIYRQLRDFISLHGHYRVASVYLTRDQVLLPEFPKTSLPYFKFLKKEGREKGTGELHRTDFAKLQRESLENYLIGVIKAVMFRADANRLFRFFEISALSIALAQRGGIQGKLLRSSQRKAGYLRVLSSNMSRKAAHTGLLAWKRNHEPKWWLVRESYLVAVEDPGELQIFDVFLLDSDFTIERPVRYYRQGLSFLHGALENDDDEMEKKHTHTREIEPQLSKSQTIKRTFKSIGHSAGRSATTGDKDKHTAQSNGDTNAAGPSGSGSGTRRRSGSLGAREALGARVRPGEGLPVPDMADMITSSESSSDEEDPTTAAAQGPDKDGKKKKGKGKNKANLGDVSQHTFYIQNSQNRLKLVAKNEREMVQWIVSMERMASQSHWTGKNRFDSFAPIRLNVAAQWLVDGRDYFWNLSRAILLAKERIYIHDWWLSPELYLRRPGKEQYRLDRLLKRKAEEGVKIFVILYKEVSNRTTPTDSNYTKQTLVNLHPNIMVQRSPSHFSTGTFYWAHHEKMCVIDEAIAFMGGLDACFGRWDTAQHVLIDDGEPNGPEGNEQIWVGKDYSNSRVMDFHTLNKPEQDMYDRTKVPRMPWHDVAMQIVGQPARDLCRHFVQRWNYLLRVKNHSRKMPFLLPPPDFKPSELTEQGLTGTCELQICRSAGAWSLGTQNRVEHSIQNAYLKAIQLSEHFVYIENQFFITSTTVNDVAIENKIGDALVNRIIRAHHDGVKWKACIVIPLLPGFTFPIDHGEASAVRLIMECQNRTISRGPNSIFARLRKEGIDPDEYISFFSLRGWGKLAGDVLTTEQVYIHGKIMVVDDRVVIIGSANINDRSQRGDRDSELASVIRDTDMIDSRMAGKPFKVGRFAHTLRVRLMREHLGVDVDAMYQEDLMANEPKMREDEVKTWDPDNEQKMREEGVSKVKQHGPAGNIEVLSKDTMGQVAYGAEEVGLHKLGRLGHKLGATSTTQGGNDATVDEERKMFSRSGKKEAGFADSVVPTLEEKTVMEHRPRKPDDKNEKPLEDALKVPGGQGVDPKEATTPDGEKFGAPADASTSAFTDNQPPHARSGDKDVSPEEQGAVHARTLLRKHLSVSVGAKPWTIPTPAPEIDPHGFKDPACDEFFKEVWVAAAVHNTEIYRKVFHCTPDDLVTTWKQYKEFAQHQERLSKVPKDSQMPAEPVGTVPGEGAGVAENPGHHGMHHLGEGLEAGNRNDNLDAHTETEESNDQPSSPRSSPSTRRNGKDNVPGGKPANMGPGQNHTFDTRSRRPTHPDEPLEQWEREEMEELLQDVRGHLVVFPTRFLEGEDVANNFLFNTDRLLPLPIYD